MVVLLKFGFFQVANTFLKISDDPSLSLLIQVGFMGLLFVRISFLGKSNVCCI